MRNKFLSLIKYFFLFIFSIIIFNSCEKKSPYNQGKILYENFCANCHMEDGTGLVEVIPPLANSDYLIKYPEKLPCMIKKGIAGEMVVNGKKYNTEMPGSPKLTEFEITNVINYINTSWGNKNPIAKHLEVRKQLSNCE